MAPRPVTPNQDTGIEATVTGGANVKSVPTGDVVFLVQGVEYVVPLTGGRAFLDLAPGTLAVGSSGVSAGYPGDDVFEPNNASLPLDVVPTTTGVAVESSTNPSTPGQGVTFTANVSVATGNQQCAGCLVTFSADGATLGTSAVGVAGGASSAQ